MPADFSQLKQDIQQSGVSATELFGVYEFCFETRVATRIDRGSPAIWVANPCDTYQADPNRGLTWLMDSLETEKSTAITPEQNLQLIPEEPQRKAVILPLIEDLTCFGFFVLATKNSARRRSVTQLKKTAIRSIQNARWKEESDWAVKSQRTLVETFHYVQEQDQKHGQDSTSADSLKTTLIRLTKNMIRELSLNRCGILLPSEDNRKSWMYVAASDFSPGGPKDSRLYRRGHGLSGRALQASPGDRILTHNIEGDCRWSNFGEGTKFSRTSPRDDDSEMGLVSLPIFSRFRQRENRPIAALTCIRSRCGNEYGLFREREILLLETIAAHLSYVVDVAMWRRDSTSHRKRQLELSRIWASRRTESQMFTEALRVFQKEFPFPRLLLCLVDPDRRRIIGKSVVGFDDDLVADTVRPIHYDEPLGFEDVLSKICRINQTAPICINPLEEPNHGNWSRHLHLHTKTKYKMYSPLIFIPMTNYGGDVLGVVVAEDDRAKVRPRSGAEIDQYSLYANHLGSLLELHNIRAHQDRQHCAQNGLLQAFKPDRDTAWSAEPVLRKLLSDCCEKFGFDQGLVYKHDENNHVLEGVVGHKLNCQLIRSTIYTLLPDELSKERETSLACSVFLKRKPVFLPCCGDETTVIDQDDRKAVGIPKDSGILGVPLIHGQNITGVLILCCRDTIQITTTCMQRIQSIGRVAAIALAVEATSQKLESNRKAAVGQETIVRQISSLANELFDWQPPEGSNTGIDTTIFDVVLKDAAKLFGCPVATLYLSDQPNELPSDGEDSRGSMSKSKFYFAAGVGFVEGVSRRDMPTFTASEMSITSEVLTSLQSSKSPNLFLDSRYTGKLNRHLIVKRDDKARTKNGVRYVDEFWTWMGIPLVMQADDESTFVYGLITFERPRKTLTDTLAFTARDLATASDIAWLLSTALYSQHKVHLVRSALRDLLRIFSHEGIPLPLNDVIDTHVPEVLETLQKETVTATDKATAIQQCGYIHELVEFFLLIFGAYDSFISNDYEWHCRNKRNISVVLQQLKRIVRSRATAKSIAISIVVDKNLVVEIDHCKVLFCTTTVIMNAIQAYKTPHIGSSAEIQIRASLKPGCLVIAIRDNGPGVPEKLQREIFELGRAFDPHTGKRIKSRGLGLAMVKRFLDAAKYDPESNEEALSVKSPPDESSDGTEFTMRFPVDHLT